MTIHTIHSGQSIQVAPFQWNGDRVDYQGTQTGLVTANVTFTGYNSLSSITDAGTHNALAYGSLTVGVGQSVEVGSINLSYAAFKIPNMTSATLMLDRVSYVKKHSTLTMYGRFGGGILDFKNGRIEVSNSTINLDGNMVVKGHGTIHSLGDSLIRLNAAGPDITVKLDSGTLSLTNGMRFLGTITDNAPGSSRIGPNANVEVFNVANAVRETFSRASGMLDLFDTQGTKIAAIHFSGHEALYTTWAQSAENGAGAMVVSSHHSAASLPTSFT